MKKITLLAALLGATYFTNAQVGIGIPNPVNSTQLDVTATDKGILIPRVVLTDLNVYSPIVGDKVESLLVYNNVENTASTIPNGFYYWTIDADNPQGYWNRIADAKLLSDLTGDVSEIQKFINYIIPTNPGNTSEIIDNHTTLVYENGNFYSVTYNAENKVYQRDILDLSSLMAGLETKTFIREVKDNNDKVTGYIYFSEQTIIDWLASDPVNNTLTNIPNTAPGVFTIDVKGTVVNNIQEILESPTNITVDGTTFTTVEEYIQYISQFSEGNVIYTQIQDPSSPDDPDAQIWVFQYWNGTSYETIDLSSLVASLETNTTIVTYNNKQYYLSESYIKAGGETDPALWTSVPTGVIHVDVVGGVVNNIQEILESPTNITVDGTTFTTVEEYIQYISQFSEGNVIYTQIQDPSSPDDPNAQIWVFQYWNGTSYETIDLSSLVASLETKTQILRSEVTENGALPIFETTRTAPLVADVKKGEIFYQYKAEDNQVDYINLTQDMLSSITNNEDIQNAITGILNKGGNVYFGDHDDDSTTLDTFYQYIDINGVQTKQEIILPASMIVNTIKNDVAFIIKQALGNHLNDTTNVVYTGNTYNNKKIYLVKGTTTIVDYSAVAAPVEVTGTTISEVLSIKLLQGTNVVTSSTTNVIINNNKIEFNIGVGNQYVMLPAGTYDVLIEFVSDEIIQ